MRSFFLWGFTFIGGKVLKDPHLLGYRMSAVSKSFTRQMGRNEFLKDAVEKTLNRVLLITHKPGTETASFQ